MRIFTSLLILSLAIALPSCQPLFPLLRTLPDTNRHVPDQNIILFRTNTNDGITVPMPVRFQRQMLDKVNQTLRNAGKEPLVIRSWCPCDSSLVLLEGKDLDLLNISGKEMASSTRPSGGVEGNPPTGTVSYDGASNTLKWDELIAGGSPNYILTLPYTVTDGKTIITIPTFELPTTPTTQPFIVAITDTGIRPEKYPALNNWFWVNPDEIQQPNQDNNGMVDDRIGWDFVNKIKMPFDSNGHGTLVASLIHEQLGNADWVNGHVRFMYLKTFDANGKGTLFNNMCALSYARQKGAKIINASWGYYNAHKSALLDYFLRELKDNQVLFVAAAGNKSPGIENSWLNLIPQSSFRNLEINPFWPANYSSSHDNVITVTTVHPKGESSPSAHSTRNYNAYETCEDQNRSDRYVNAGVLNITQKKADCNVRDFTKEPPVFTSGSSFAAPVLTGKLAAKLGQNWPGNQRHVLLEALDQFPPSVPGQPVLRRHASLESQINKGVFIIR